MQIQLKNQQRRTKRIRKKKKLMKKRKRHEKAVGSACAATYQPGDHSFDHPQKVLNWWEKKV